MKSGMPEKRRNFQKFQNFFFDSPQPTRLKIDVDGLERAVVSGATEVIDNPRLRDILIEINENDREDRGMIEKLEKSGFHVIVKGASVTDVAGNYRMTNMILRRGER